MNWYKKATNKPQMSPQEALSIFGLKTFPSSLQELSKIRKILILKVHPDLPNGSNEKAAKINNAFEVLEQNIGGTYHFQDRVDYSRPNKNNNYYTQETERPLWQTDLRSAYNGVGDSWRDVNRCKKDIYEKAKENGSVYDIHFWAFDGSFIRGSFTAKCNLQTLGFAGEVMEFWNSRGFNSYPTVCVLAEVDYNIYQIIRLRGQDIVNKNIKITSHGWNQNPSNDPAFMKELKEKINELVY